MPRRTRHHLARRSCALWVEPLEDRQLLSALYPVGGEYSRKADHATAEYATTDSSLEYVYAKAPEVGTSAYSPREVHHEKTARHATPSLDQRPGYDTTANPNEYAPHAAAEAKQETYSASQDASSPAQKPSCEGNTPLALEYARAAATDPEYAQAVPTDSEIAIRLAGAVAPQVDPEESGGAGVSSTAEDRPSPPTGPAATAPAGAPGSGSVIVASAASSATTHDVVHGPRPVATDDAGLVSRGIDAEPGSEEPLEPETDVADSQTPAPSPQLAPLVVGTAPIDLPALQRGVDQFFSQLEGLGQELPKGPLLLRLAPWIATVAVTTAALEVARWQMRKQSPRRAGWIVRPHSEES